MAINIILFDDDIIRDQLLPLTFTKPISEILCGILTLQEKWKRRFNSTISNITADYLTEKYSLLIASDNLLIRSEIMADDDLCVAIEQLELGKALYKNNKWLAARLSNNDVEIFCKTLSLPTVTHIEYQKEVSTIERPWDIFRKNGDEIKKDFKLVTKGRMTHRISENNRLKNHSDIFIEEGVKVEFSIINAEEGPVYIAKNAQIMEGSIIRGPFYLGEESVVKMGAKIYGPTSIGSHSKVGGEINNSVVFNYSNKAHDGFLGNSVIGEWCNLGADTNNSNLKNDYSEVKLWSYKEKSFIKTGLQFCGLIMGDHTKCGINSMFNTGTVTGVACNIFGDGFPRNFISSFSWGGAAGFSDYKFEKFLQVARIVMDRRNISLSKQDEKILLHIYSLKDK